MINKKWYENPYAQTKKTVSDSIGDIKNLLIKYGVNKYQETRFPNIISLKFIVSENGKDIPFEFLIALPNINQNKGEQKQNQHMRAYFYYLKSRMEILTIFNLRPFSEEFALDRLLKLPNEQLRTLRQIIDDQKDKLEYAEHFFLPNKE